MINHNHRQPNVQQTLEPSIRVAIEVSRGRSASKSVTSIVVTSG